MELTNRQRRDAGMAYISDDTIFEEQLVCRKILQKLNFMDRSDFAGIKETVKEARQFLKELGFQYFCTYEKQQPVFHGL